MHGPPCITPRWCRGVVVEKIKPNMPLAGINRGLFAHFFVTSEQVLLDSGWKAWSPGMVARIL